MSAKDTLRINKTGLQTTLCSDPKFILNKVHEKNLVTQREYINLKCIVGENVETHVIELVDKIMNKGEETCRDFLDLLQTDKDIKSTYPELRQMKLHVARPLFTPVQVSSVSSEVPLEQDVQSQKMDNFYPLNSQPVGLCLIINNKGSAKDAQSLAEVFSRLGFRVLMCKDQTKDQMKQTLTCFDSLTNSAQLQEFNVEEWSGSGFTKPQPILYHGDAFICCVLSHGDMSEVEGSDGKPFSIKEITKIFKATEQSALKGKPKVFLIQACQKEDPQQGVLPPKVSLIQACQGDDIQQGVLRPDLEEDASGSCYIPEEADFLVAIATVEDYAEDGSWFIQSVCRQLTEHCPRGENLPNILTDVNNEVSKKEGSTAPGEAKVLISWSTLRKRLVLSPKRN